jgi:hypothetical protein
VKSSAATVDEYLDELSPERRDAVSAVRETVLAKLPGGYEEMMDFGMIAYVVPLERYPKTYNGHPLTYAGISSEKRYVSVHLMNIYGDAETERWFVDSYRATGKRLDMGKSCVRFRRLEDLPLDLIGEAVGRTPVNEFIQRYEDARSRKPSR